MDPWYKIAQPRKEVREGRSFNPSEFAIHLEQVVAGTAPEDYRNPAQFFARTYFTRALGEHTGMVLRRLAGETVNTAPVMTLVTQFGGGKTHTLTALYHMVSNASSAISYTGVSELVSKAGIRAVPDAKVATFVGNAWDPREGRETPWIDIARQLAGEAGVKELGASAVNTPPGTEALARVFHTAGKPVLLLFDEVLNFINRHRGMAEQFHAFIQNLTVATTAITHGAALISLPRSQVEMTDWDQEWQDRITKVVRRVAKDLIANDETEISEVVRRRLFEDIGSERIRKNVAKVYADWCFERRAQLPPERMMVESASTETRARESLRQCFEACYPFHPATLSVFQRKWSSLTHYQQTRGTLAMLAQWISWAFRDGYRDARREPLITLGSAPLEVSDFRSVVLGSLGESRLQYAVDADIAGAQSHARALDADTKGALADIHRRVGTTIFFESSGGQTDKMAHLPDLRFALGEPDVDTTSIDNAAFSLEDKSYYMRRVGADGFKISYQPTMRKVVSDRRASLDEDTEVKPAMRSLIQKEFERGASVPLVLYPSDGTAVQDSPRLTLVVVDPGSEWLETGDLRRQIADWTRQRGKSPRLYPGSLVWCLKRPGRDLKDKVETWLAWRRVAKEVMDGSLGTEFDRSERADIQSKVADAENAAKDEIWGGYRFAVIADNSESDGLKTIDLGAGHSSAAETLCGRVLTALKAQGLLSESVGASYIERKWPPAFKDSGAWPLSSLRQSFLNGSLTRLLDPDTFLRSRIPEFVLRGEFGLASGQKGDGGYSRVYFSEYVDPAEVSFDAGVFLLIKEKARALKAVPETVTGGADTHEDDDSRQPLDDGQTPETETEPADTAGGVISTFRISGDVPPELWNRLGTKVIPKLRSGTKLRIGIDFSVSIDGQLSQSFESDLRQILDDLGLSGRVRIN